MKMTIPVDITNQRFGRLLALEPTDGRCNGSIIWKFECDCGNFTFIRPGDAASGNTKSCGCLRIEKLSLPKGTASFNYLFNRYKVESREKNHEFALSKDDFRYLTSQNCYYCGDRPRQKASNGRKIRMNDLYIYNGIDRFDNEKGYVMDNCVPCCKMCNYAKRNVLPKEFFDWIERVYLLHFEDHV